MKHCLGIWMILFALSFPLYTTGKALPDTGRQVLSLGGSDWLIHEATGAGLPEDAGWIPATVPGNIQSDLEKQPALGRDVFFFRKGRSDEQGI